MSVAAPVLIESGVDYITATATHPPRTHTLREIGYEHIEREAQNGNAINKWRGLGYAGKECGSASVGAGEQGTIVRLSSGVAREFWKELVFFSTNITRLDLQITLQSTRTASDVVKTRWKQVSKHWHTHQSFKPPKVIVSPSGCETIQIGSRQSERYGRIYDKRVESGLECYDRCVRYEVEFKRHWSKSLATQLSVHREFDLAVKSRVCQFFSARGVVLGSAMIPSETIVLPSRTSDSHSFLRYAAKCLSSPARRAVESQGIDAVLEAFGLSEYARSR